LAVRARLVRALSFGSIAMEQKTREITSDELDRMTPEDRNKALLSATKISATAVVLGPDGRPKYDDDSRRGSYGE